MYKKSPVVRAFFSFARYLPAKISPLPRPGKMLNRKPYRADIWIWSNLKFKNTLMCSADYIIRFWILVYTYARDDVIFFSGCKLSHIHPGLISVCRRLSAAWKNRETGRSKVKGKPNIYVWIEGWALGVSTVWWRILEYRTVPRFNLHTRICSIYLHVHGTVNCEVNPVYRIWEGPCENIYRESITYLPTKMLNGRRKMMNQLDRYIH